MQPINAVQESSALTFLTSRFLHAEETPKRRFSPFTNLPGAFGNTKSGASRFTETGTTESRFALLAKPFLEAMKPEIESAYTAKHSL
jgi:hypothetical protein